MRTQQLPAGSLRIGQRVVRDGCLLVVSSVRFEGAGGGVVSVEFAGEARWSTFAPGEVLVVLEVWLCGSVAEMQEAYCPFCPSAYSL